MRVTGVVKFFNTAKGFGFITPESGGKDVFVHATALEAAGIRSLNEGDKVSFVLEDDRRGRGKQAGQKLRGSDSMRMNEGALCETARAPSLLVRSACNFKPQVQGW
jgi:cold shock protein